MTVSVVQNVDRSDVLPDAWPLLVAFAAAGIGLIILHVWLCRRNPVWLGAIVPAAYVALAGYLASQQESATGLIVGNVLVVFLLLVVWWEGQEKRRARREG
ncbi:hypothetical protein [Homoserinibacter sp. GY 40078]|uniref:hypothetical protein n=1 Tax=Homoserinibacter sp. GY 40078 TaxID=2603275 RepID=UPI0011CA6573|nr:hypothetical protein [Homoserinibacter sp. GY 40078]TXK19759.1 hypothetical protein FVQ89_07835 [Homoserinibacter sp. GY 40078]